MSGIQDLPQEIIINHIYPYITFSTCIKLCSIKSLRTMFLSYWSRKTNITTYNELDVRPDYTSLQDILENSVNDPSNADPKILFYLLNTTNHPYTDITVSSDLIVWRLVNENLNSHIIPLLINSSKFIITRTTKRKIEKLIVNICLQTSNVDLLEHWSSHLELSNIDGKESCLISMIKNEELNFQDNDVVTSENLGYYGNKYKLKKFDGEQFKKLIPDYNDKEYKEYLIGWTKRDIEITGNMDLITNNECFTLKQFFKTIYSTKHFIKSINSKVKDFILKANDSICDVFKLSDFLECDEIDFDLLEKIATYYFTYNEDHDPENRSCSNYKTLEDVDKIEKLLIRIAEKCEIAIDHILSLMFYERALIYANNRHLWHKILSSNCPNEIIRALFFSCKGYHKKTFPRLIKNEIQEKIKKIYLCSVDESEYCVFDPEFEGFCRFHKNRNSDKNKESSNIINIPVNNESDDESGNKVKYSFTRCSGKCEQCEIEKCESESGSDLE